MQLFENITKSVAGGTILSLLTLASLPTVAGCLPTQNATIPVLDGCLNHSKNNLFCVPITWYIISIFFFSNYVTHAATVKSRPGQKFRHVARDFILYSGLLRVFTWFFELSRGKDALIKAYHVGALWVVEGYDRSYDPTPPSGFPVDQFVTHRVENGNQEGMSPNGLQPQDDSQMGEAIPLENILSHRNPTGFVEVKPHKWREMGETLSDLITFIFGAIPIAVIAGLTYFKAGQSTPAQRVWTMMWLSFGVILGPYVESFSWHDLREGFVGESTPLELFTNSVIGVGFLGARLVVLSWLARC